MDWVQILKKVGAYLIVIFWFLFLNTALILRLVWEFSDVDVVVNGVNTTADMWQIITDKKLSAALNLPYINKGQVILIYVIIAIGLFISLKTGKLLADFLIKKWEVKNTNQTIITTNNNPQVSTNNQQDKLARKIIKKTNKSLGIKK